MQTEQLFCLSNKSGLAPSWPTALWSLVKKKIQTWDAVHVCCGFLRWPSILHQSQHRQLCQVYLWLVSDGNLENLPSSEHSGCSSALTLNMKTQNGTAVMPGAFVKAGCRWPARELQLQLHRKMVLSKVHAEGLLTGGDKSHHVTGRRWKGLLLPGSDHSGSQKFWIIQCVWDSVNPRAVVTLNGLKGSEKSCIWTELIAQGSKKHETWSIHQLEKSFSQSLIGKHVLH